MYLAVIRWDEGMWTGAAKGWVAVNAVWNYEFHDIWGICWLRDDTLAAPQEGLFQNAVWLVTQLRGLSSSFISLIFISKNILLNAIFTKSTVTSLLEVHQWTPNCIKNGSVLNFPTEDPHSSGSLQSRIYVVLKCSEVEMLPADIQCRYERERERERERDMARYCWAAIIDVWLEY